MTLAIPLEPACVARLDGGTQPHRRIERGDEVVPGLFIEGNDGTFVQDLDRRCSLDRSMNSVPGTHPGSPPRGR